MKTYTLREGREGFGPRHKITEEGMQILFAAYSSLHGTSQSMERIQERGGFGIVELDDWKQQGRLPKDFDWTKYKVSEDQIREAAGVDLAMLARHRAKASEAALRICSYLVRNKPRFMHGLTLAEKIELDDFMYLLQYNGISSAPYEG
jgi:hypothetical protein